MGRFGTKLDVERSRRELPLTPFFFDLLRLEGDDLHDAPARERFRALREAAPSFAVTQRITSDPAEADAFFEEALARGHEGMMMKDPEDATRRDAGRRLAQTEAGAHARPGRARGRVGTRPAKGTLEQPPPGA
jgi:DNA ligase-1